MRTFSFLRLASLAVAAFVCAPLPPARAADAPLYAFVDAEGVLHITDRLGDVPEPFHSAYRRRDALLAADANNRPSGSGADRQAPTPPVLHMQQIADAPAAASQADARRQWQQLMATWRDKLTSSALALQKAEAEAQGANNPLLRETPAGRQRLQAAQSQLATVRSDTLEARRMLLETLPARAKREHVPPQWLGP